MLQKLSTQTRFEDFSEDVLTTLMIQPYEKYQMSRQKSAIIKLSRYILEICFVPFINNSCRDFVFSVNEQQHRRRKR